METAGGDPSMRRDTDPRRDTRRAPTEQPPPLADGRPADGAAGTSASPAPGAAPSPPPAVRNERATWDRSVDGCRHRSDGLTVHADVDRRQRTPER
jgi:hypothetical protein